MSRTIITWGVSLVPNQHQLSYDCGHTLATITTGSPGFSYTIYFKGWSRPWSYGSWIYNYLCNQCLWLLKLWVRTSSRVMCTTLCDKVCQWLATGRWFSPGPQVSSTNKTDRHDITEILLKVALNTIKQTNIIYFSLYFIRIVI